MQDFIRGKVEPPCLETYSVMYYQIWLLVVGTDTQRALLIQFSSLIYILQFDLFNYLLREDAPGKYSGTSIIRHSLVYKNVSDYAI